MVDLKLVGVLIIASLEVALAGTYCTTGYSYLEYCTWGCCYNSYSSSRRKCCDSPTGLIVGLVVGGLALVAGIIVAICCCRRRAARQGVIVNNGQATVVTTTAGYPAQPYGVNTTAIPYNTGYPTSVPATGMQQGTSYPQPPPYQENAKY